MTVQVGSPIRLVDMNLNRKAPVFRTMPSPTIAVQQFPPSSPENTKVSQLSLSSSQRDGDARETAMRARTLAFAAGRLVYDHRFHFGSAGDCFKHVVLLSLLKGMREKDAGFTYCETHAGCGLYDYSSTLREHEQGLERLLVAEQRPGVLGEYAALQQETYAAKEKYLGSAGLAATQLRPQDGALLFEKSDDIYDILTSNVPNAEVICGDGYSGLAAACRGNKKRGLVFIDPPYQDGSDTDRSINLLKDIRRHWRAARIALWYPASPKSKANNQRLLDLAATFDCDSLQVEVAIPAAEGRLSTAGFLLVQPPYLLEDHLRDVVLPDLADLLHVEQSTVRTTHIPAAAAVVR